MKINGVVLTHAFADTAFFLFEVKATLIDVGDQRNGLGKVDMHGLVAGYILIEAIRVFDRAVLHTGGATGAFVSDDVAGLFGQGDRKVTCLSIYAVDFGIG